MVTKEQLHDPCGGHLSLDFVNAAGRTSRGIENERLVDYRALLTWSAQAGCVPPRLERALVTRSRKHPTRAAEVWKRALELREAAFTAFHDDLHERRPRKAAFETINAELSRALAHARVEPEGRAFGWTWDLGDTPLDAPLWPIARAIAELLVSPERERVKECAGETCLWLFIDRSRNQGRRWCDMKSCGNQAKVRRHRSRNRTT